MGVIAPVMNLLTAEITTDRPNDSRQNVWWVWIQCVFRFWSMWRLCRNFQKLCCSDIFLVAFKFDQNATFEECHIFWRKLNLPVWSSLHNLHKVLGNNFPNKLQIWKIIISSLDLQWKDVRVLNLWLIEVFFYKQLKYLPPFVSRSPFHHSLLLGIVSKFGFIFHLSIGGWM